MRELCGFVVEKYQEVLNCDLYALDDNCVSEYNSLGKQNMFHINSLAIYFLYHPTHLLSNPA